MDNSLAKKGSAKRNRLTIAKEAEMRGVDPGDYIKHRTRVLDENKPKPEESQPAATASAVDPPGPPGEPQTPNEEPKPTGAKIDPAGAFPAYMQTPEWQQQMTSAQGGDSGTAALHVVNLGSEPITLVAETEDGQTASQELEKGTTNTYELPMNCVVRYYNKGSKEPIHQQRLTVQSTSAVFDQSTSSGVKTFVLYASLILAGAGIIALIVYILMKKYHK